MANKNVISATPAGSLKASPRATTRIATSGTTRTPRSGRAGHKEHSAPLLVPADRQRDRELITSGDPIETPLGWRVAAAHNLALSEAARFEVDNEEGMYLHSRMLRYTQMWPSSVEQFKRDLAEGQTLEDALSMFGARKFYGGLAAGRSEQGKKNCHGTLIWDAPHNMTPVD